MDKVGYVIGERNGRVILDVKKTGSCGEKCVTCQSHCEVPSVRVELDNNLMAKRGDFVELGMNPRNLVKSTFIMYTIPVVMFIAGLSIAIKYFEARGFENYELYGLIVGFVVLALTFVLIRVITDKLNKDKPSILEMKQIL
ncbi:MAG: SoxR reducing system RseC family protein [Clostridiales bacterium]|nr:SoxR reducing system RseC family protein [Clostridiales bacterium]